MAMLQLGGTLSNATVRITPRISWWITAQHFYPHLLFASSIAASPNEAKESTKDPKIEKIIDKQQKQNDKSNIVRRRSLITAAFKSLMVDSNQPNTMSEKVKDINQQIHSATTVDQILELSNDPNFDIKNASTVIYELCNWIQIKKINMNDIEKDPRYKKICNMLGMSNSGMAFVKPNITRFDNLEEILEIDKMNSFIRKLNTPEMIKTLSTLANHQKRFVPLLQNISKKLVVSKEQLNIKQIADILYSMAVLTFYDEELLVKMCNDLVKVIPTNTRNAVIGSILTSMGLLRYRNEEVLDLLSAWIFEHQSIIRSQEINSLLMTLAFVGYTPKNFNEVFEHVIKPLTESDMCQSSEWLDNIWALTILEQAENKHYESVLNSGFINRLFDTGSNMPSIPKALKLLNVNAAARLLCPEYKGQLLPEDSNLFGITIMRRKEKSELSNAIISALKILLPSDESYLNINVNTNMGFLIDAEFCVDNNCTPLVINSTEKQNKLINRIAILSCAYNEYCRGVNEVKGPIKFYRKLLEHQGYKVLLIPYSKVNTQEKLVTRAKYINDNIKLLLEKKS